MPKKAGKKKGRFHMPLHFFFCIFFCSFDRSVFGRLETLRFPDPSSQQRSTACEKGFDATRNPTAMAPTWERAKTAHYNVRYLAFFHLVGKTAFSMPLQWHCWSHFTTRSHQAYVNPSFTSCLSFRYKPSTTAKKRYLQEADFLFFFTTFV